MEREMIMHRSADTIGDDHQVAQTKIVRLEFALHLIGLQGGIAMNSKQRLEQCYFGRLVRSNTSRNGKSCV